MSEIERLLRASFDQMVDGFRLDVRERRRQGQTREEIEALLDQADTTMKATWDDGTRILVMERFREVLREEYEPDPQTKSNR